MGIVYIDAVRPRPVNWSPTFGLKDKIPFGLYVFDNESPILLKTNKVEKVSKTAYEYLEPLYDYDTLVNNYKVKGTILKIDNRYNIDEESTKELFYFVAHGNNVFISASNFPKMFKDSLNVVMDFEDFSSKKSNYFSFANKALNASKYNFNVGGNDSYFSKIDTINTTILGYQKQGKTQHVNFIKVAFGSGYFYLHSQPICFTNYYLLKNDYYKYTQSVASYIPKGNLLWLIKDQNGEIASDSPMRFWLSQPALRWAWYLGLLGLLLFMIFNAKRKQRIIPIQKPLANTSIDFARTIGNLYYQEGNYQNIIDKKIIYFLEKIRTDYHLDTTVLNEDFIRKLQQKTAKNLVDVQDLVKLIQYHQKGNHQSVVEDLIQLNTAIERILK